MAYHGFAVRTEHGPQWTGKMALVHEHLADPLRWKKPRRVFVNSMSDLFHERLANEEIAAVFGIMAQSHHHTFQILTKRAERMRDWFEWVSSFEDEHGPPPEHVCTIEAVNRIGDMDQVARPWPLPNVWLGVSVEDQQRADERIPELLRTPAAVRFISYEPALSQVAFYDEWMTQPGPNGVGRRGLDQIIVGGESGPGARPFDLAWARFTVTQCRRFGVKAFVKQMGSRPYDSGGPVVEGVRIAEVSLLDRKGGDPTEWPTGDWPREFPS